MSAIILEPGTLLQRNAALTAVDMDGQTVMLDVEQGAYFSLDDVGGEIWSALESPASVGDLIQIVVNVFDAPDIDVLKQDILEFLHDVIDQGIVQLVDAS